MSLPTSKAPAAQLSIRSFFQARSPPQYAPPPSARDVSSSSSSSRNGADHSAASSSPAAPAQQQQESPASPPLPCVDAPPPPPPANLPREACVRPVADADISALRRINALLLPVCYPDAFYQSALNPAESARFSRVVTWARPGEDQPKVVGGVVCRLEPASQNLYIQSLCLLSPYRGLGLINAAVDSIVATAASDPKLDVRTVTAHVWSQNDEGLHWYGARGFQRREPLIQGYYLKLRPDSAWLVERHVGASVRSSLPCSAPASAPAPRAVAPSTVAAVLNLPTPPSSGRPPPPQSSTGIPPPAPSRGQSYQKQRPETEWNDLPADMAPSLLAPPRKSASEPASGASSRSSSMARKKKDRSYPAAAFGS